MHAVRPYGEFEAQTNSSIKNIFGRFIHGPIKHLYFPYTVAVEEPITRDREDLKSMNRPG